MAFSQKKSNVRSVPNGNVNTIYYNEDEMSKEPSGMAYENPYQDAYNLPEGQTYPVPSLAPKEALKDPNNLPLEINPIDYKMGNTLDPERTQRNLIRTYLEQKYADAAKNTDVEAARAAQEKTVALANLGHGIDRMFTAHSAARGGQGADAAYWQGLKTDAARRVQGAEDERKAKISDYLMKKNLGREGVEDLAASHKSDREMAMQNPNSETSQLYQTAFAQMYPEYAENIDQVPAVDIMNWVNMAGQKQKWEFQKSMELARNGLMERNVAVNEQKAATEFAPTPKSQAELDLIKARTDLVKSQAAKGSGEYVPTPKAQAELDILKARKDLLDAQVLKEKGVGPGKKPISEGQKAVDRSFAKDYLEWESNGKPAYRKNLNLLMDAKQKLEKSIKEGKGSQISGKWQSTIGGFGKGQFRNEEGLAIQGQVETAASGAIKSIMGSSNISNTDVERVMQMSWDTRLSPDENIKKIDASIKHLQEQAAQKEAMSQYYGKNGTLEGFATKKIDDDKAALEWARKNPNDERAKEILKLFEVGRL